MKKIIYSFLLLILPFSASFAQYRHFMTVAKDGSGDYKTITEAIESLPMFNYERVTIYIKNGIYNEKFKITQDYVTLRGESEDSTIIEYNQLRTDWIANKDVIGPAVINIEADDIVLNDLTIKNTQPQVGPHAFAIYGTGTRIIITQCNVLSKGGDTVSLWDYKTGMYYHADCSFVGSVDFVCPRGWCFIKNSSFYELKKTASIWHAGGYEKEQKFVIRDCSFDGVKGFQLGRHHYDAQFYLIDCNFSKAIADTPIYRVTYPDHPEKNRPSNWGERDYYYNCERQGGNFVWFKNNLNTAAGRPKPSDITPAWTFGGRWDPESKKGPAVSKYKIEGNYVLLYFNEIITVIGKPELKTANGKILTYNNGAGSDTIRFDAASELNISDLKGLRITNQAKMIGTTASVYERKADLSIAN